MGRKRRSLLGGKGKTPSNTEEPTAKTAEEKVVLTVPDEVASLPEYPSVPPVSEAPSVVDPEEEGVGLEPDGDPLPAYLADAPSPGAAVGQDYSSAGMGVGENDAEFLEGLYGASSEGAFQFSGNASASESGGRFAGGLASGSESSDRPSYLATPTPAPQRRTELPPAVGAPDIEDDEDDDRLPIGRFVVAGGALFVLVLVMLVLAVASQMLRVEATTAETPKAEHHEGVEVRGDMRQAPKVFGDLDDEPSPDLESDPSEPEPEPEEDEPEAPAVEAEPLPPPPAPQPRPQVAPAPAPAPAPQPTAEAVKGTLKIRSNRRVLVYVNGAALGYTPQDFQGRPGSFSVSAMLPSQPDSKQTRDITISAAGAVHAVEFSF
jgi:hypothetical protein